MSEMWARIRSRRNSWLVPLLVLLAVASLLLIVGNDSVLAPFRYSAF